jgi:hypothetical protein
VGDALPGIAANRQVCPTYPEITFGNHHREWILETNFSWVERMSFRWGT